jgi:hypothetical protein
MIFNIYLTDILTATYTKVAKSLWNEIHKIIQKYNKNKRAGRGYQIPNTK